MGGGGARFEMKILKVFFSFHDFFLKSYYIILQIFKSAGITKCGMHKRISEKSILN